MMVVLFWQTSLRHCINHEFVGNKAKGRISKRVFQENKARQIFRKTNISYHLIGTHTCVYQRVRNVCFSEKSDVLCFLENPFWNSPFCRTTEDIPVALNPAVTQRSTFRKRRRKGNNWFPLSACLAYLKLLFVIQYVSHKTCRQEMFLMYSNITTMNVLWNLKNNKHLHNYLV